MSKLQDEALIQQPNNDDELISVQKRLAEVKLQVNTLKRQLRQRTALFSIFLQRMGGVTFEFDLQNDTTYFTSIDETGKSSEHIVTNFRSWMMNRIEDGNELLRRLQEFVETNGASAKYGDETYGSVESQAKFLTNELRWYRADYQVLRDEENKVCSLIGYITDINDEVAKRITLETDAKRDSMTKLYNRGVTEHIINQRIAALKEREKGVLFLLDVDNFKQVNDTLGHLAGDNYLKGVANALTATFREEDLIGRIGGDEFVVFLSGMITIDTIEKQGQRLVDLFMKIPCKNNLRITCSIGIAATSDSKMNYETLLAQADTALYRSKEWGKNRFRLYEDKL